MQKQNLELQIVSEYKNIQADAWIYVNLLKKGQVGKPEKKDVSDPKLDIETLLNKTVQPMFLAAAKRRGYKAKPGESLVIDDEDLVRRTLVSLKTDDSMFTWLTHARSVMGPAIFDIKAKHAVIDLSTCGILTIPLTDAFVSAVAAGSYKFPKYSSNKEHDGSQGAFKLTIVAAKTDVKDVREIAQNAAVVTNHGTNLVRWLAKRAGNDLSCKAYIQYIKNVATTYRLQFDHLDSRKLRELKAGAFLAVVQGSDHQDYGIVKLSYKPAKAKKRIALVGKGIVFDTGGHNIKTTHMLGMHGDMAGSAVALAVLQVIAHMKLPVDVTAYLAIADNMVGPKSYKPNDVVTAMNGTTIEIIDTDAEGRMVLSDTLTLASQTKPDLLMDFATLTGSCIRAIGTTFSGVFSNRAQLGPTLIAAGSESGERVWPFPMDADFADCLESTSADIKQCREKGGVDHIEASQFLKRFVDEGVPWVHVDLSSIEHTGGLAHVPTDETGFGVRFALKFIEKYLQLSSRS